ncbi:MAG: hypothetical protein AAF982_01395 [Pseudomonadota bacterium]
MSAFGLARCLPGHLSPADWYELLNAKVFFWLTGERLHKLTGARAYRHREHDVLEVNARSLIDAHRGAIWLCPINGCCTKPWPRPRDETIFARIPGLSRQRMAQKEKTARSANAALPCMVPGHGGKGLRFVFRHVARNDSAAGYEGAAPSRDALSAWRAVGLSIIGGVNCATWATTCG